MKVGTPAVTLTLDEATHVYRLNGRVLRSVTQVIGTILVPGGYNPDDFYRERGSAAHLACRLHAEGRLDESTIDENVRPYLDAYKRFLRETGFRPIQCEVSFANEAFGFAGTPDQEGNWGCLEGAWTIIDLKSGNIPSWTGIQLAGYCVGRGQEYRPKRIAVRLQSDGGFKLIEYPLRDLSRDTNVFLAALAVYNWRKANGYID